MVNFLHIYLIKLCEDLFYAIFFIHAALIVLTDAFIAWLNAFLHEFDRCLFFLLFWCKHEQTMESESGTGVYWITRESVDCAFFGGLDSSMQWLVNTKVIIFTLNMKYISFSVQNSFEINFNLFNLFVSTLLLKLCVESLN